jgi:O-antigen/teichoic acid export membrane protein
MLDAVKRLGRGRPGGGLNLFQGFAILSGGQVLSKIVGFFVFASLARTLEPEGYGTVEYVVGLAVFFEALVECGLGAVGVRRIAHRPASLPALAAQIPLARLGLALLCVPLMVLVAMPTAHGPVARGLVWLFALSLLAVPWRQDWLMQATERMSEAAVAPAARMTVFAIVTLTLVRSPADILAVGWAEIAAVSVMSLYCVVVQQTKITPYRLRAPLDGLSGLAKEGALVGLGGLVWSANHYAPLLLVAGVVGGEETAWFAAASRIVTSLLIFSNVYFFNLYPAIARATARDRDELASLLAASFRVVAWGGILVGLALTLLAEPLCRLSFGGRFEPSGSMVRIMAWVLPLTLLSGHARWALVAAGRQLRVVYAQVAGSLAIAALGIPLVLVLGGRGAAVTWLAVTGAVWCAAHGLASRNGVRLPPLAPALVPGGLAVAVIGGTHLLGLDHWWAGLGIVVFAAAAPLLDRKLLPDLRRLSASRVDKSALPRHFAG